MRNWLLIFVLILACSGFAYYSVELTEQHVFDYSIDEVERQYYGDQWILEVRCGDYVYLFVDDIIDFNTIELPSQTDIISCGDSIISITWFEEGSDTFCEFNQIYPEDHPISVIEGMKFDHCIWSDSLNSIVYFAVEHSIYPYDVSGSMLEVELEIATATPFDALSIPGFTFETDIENIEYYNGFQLFDNFTREVYYFFTTSFRQSDNIQHHHAILFGSLISEPINTFGSGGRSYSDHNYRCDSWDGSSSTYEGLLGKSMIDIDSDRIIDIPIYYRIIRRRSETDCGDRINSETGEWEYFRETITFNTGEFETSIYRSSTGYVRYYFDNIEDMYMGHFLGNSEPVFILDDRCYYGENLTQYLPLTYCPALDSTTDINITDINNDGIHELFGIQNNKLNIFNVKSRLHIEPGWNLVSFPEFEYPVMISSLMPFSLTGFCYYDPVERAYSMEAVADENKPIFMMSMEARTIDLPPYEQLTSFTLNLVPGWNMIGSRNLFVKSEMLTENPAIAAPIYEYDTETSSYIEADILLPTKGYWVLANESLEITVP